jgi:hypothetical protein
MAPTSLLLKRFRGRVVRLGVKTSPKLRPWGAGCQMPASQFVKAMKEEEPGWLTSIAIMAWPCQPSVGTYQPSGRLDVPATAGDGTVRMLMVLCNAELLPNAVN